MTQAMDKDKVIEILEYYSQIDGNVKLYRNMIKDIELQYYDPRGAICTDGLPKGKNNISRQTENMVLNIPDCVSKDLKRLEAKVQQLQTLKSQILQEVSRLKLKEKSIIFDFYIHAMKWEQVAERNHYSERQCKNIRNAAVEKLIMKFQSNRTICEFDYTS